MEQVLSVVIVEDDPTISELIQTVLSDSGLLCSAASTALQALELIESEGPDIVLLDLGLPDADGTEVLRSIRDRGLDIGVICVTARSDELDRVLGFEFGADDYVTKPFSPRELLGRVRALGRRVTASVVPAVPDQVVLSVGDLEVDPGRREVRVKGSAVALTPIEHDLITHLVANRGLALSRTQLLEAVWGHDWLGESRTVDLHIGQVRRKLGSATTITTVRGVGYRLE